MNDEGKLIIRKKNDLEQKIDDMQKIIDELLIKGVVNDERLDS